MDAAARLSVELGRFARLHHTLKLQLSAYAPEGLDWGAFGLLADVVKRGPLRQGGLAECTLLDPSTVSRHVASLVKSGLVERRPDPADGRASLLAATASGRQAFAEFTTRRTAAVAQLVQGWNPEEVDSLSRGLARLVDDFDGRRAEIVQAIAGATLPESLPPLTSEASSTVSPQRGAHPGLTPPPAPTTDTPLASAASGPTQEH